MSEGIIKTGIYAIQNVNRGNHIVLKDDALVAGSSEHGKMPPSNALWKVTNLMNERYTIRVASQDKKLACSDGTAGIAIVIGSDETDWTIKETGRKGEYVICHVEQELFWGFKRDAMGMGTPVILRDKPTGYGNQWKFHLYLGSPADAYRPKPLSSRLFTGRSKYLKQLHQFFSMPNSSHQIRDFLLYGMGGVGKTQICLKFVEESHDLFWKVFWVDASNTDTVKVLSSNGSPL